MSESNKLGQPENRREQQKLPDFHHVSSAETAVEKIDEGPRLKIAFCNPAVRRIERGTTVWFISGGSEDDCQLLSEKTAVDGELEQKICQKRGDVSILRITSENGQPRRVSLWRGLSSAFLLYYALTHNGDVLASDSFRFVMSCLPPALRAPSEGAIIDHFLFGNVPGRNTYAKHVTKVAHGECINVDLQSQNVTSQFFDKVGYSTDSKDINSYIDDVDRSISDFMNSVSSSGKEVVLFSGGVDSTLVAYYTGPSVPCVNMRTKSDSLNARLEEQYCADAAELLGVDFNVMFEDPADYPEQLEACIDSLGAPPHALHMAWFNNAFRHLDYQTFFIAERADALFGHGGRIARFASYFTSAPAFQLLQLATAVLPPSERFKWQGILPAARKLRFPPESIHGYAGQNSVFTNMDLLEQIFSKVQIEDRLTSRLDYAVSRVDLPANYHKSFHRHFELAQWIDYFCEDTFALYRQCAHANGKSALSPFVSKEVLSVAASVPGDERYIKDGQGKYLLKRLLKKKLPGYDVDQRKAFPAVPFPSQYPNGPLGNVWERYPFPDFIDPTIKQQIVSSSMQLSWQTIKYAIWDQTIRSVERLSSPRMATSLDLRFA